MPLKRFPSDLPKQKLNSRYSSGGLINFKTSMQEKKDPVLLPTSPTGCISNRWQAEWNHTVHKVGKTHKQNMKQRKKTKKLNSSVGCWGGVFCYLLPNPSVCTQPALCCCHPRHPVPAPQAPSFHHKCPLARC